MTRIPVAGVIHTHDWDHEPGLRVDMHLREHLVNAHGIPASHWERWSFGAATEEHEDLHDRCPCTAVGPVSTQSPETGPLGWHPGKHGWESHDGYRRHAHSVNGTLIIDPHDPQPQVLVLRGERQATGEMHPVTSAPSAVTRYCASVEEMTGNRCPCTAEWIVAVGGRRTDEQAVCGRHLHRVCRAMERAEGRPGVRLTVRRA